MLSLSLSSAYTLNIILFSLTNFANNSMKKTDKLDYLQSERQGSPGTPMQVHMPLPFVLNPSHMIPQSSDAGH